MEGTAELTSPPGTRLERDALGFLPVPQDALFGIHTQRALANFPLSRRPVHPELVQAYGSVKLACLLVNRDLGYFQADPAKVQALEAACQEMAAGTLTGQVRVDALQGGAGTSTNLNVSEVIANRALQLLGLAPGTYERISPLDDVNLHQSTNDTFPTALRIAAIRGLRRLEQSVLGLQEAFQEAEQRFAHVVKVGRTELQDAVLITLGREMSAYAEALSRDRWRLHKCEERLRVVNLGGTAVGTGLGAPRAFIFRVVDVLRDLTGLGLARAENLVDATQNADVFVEVSGMLKACAASLLKITGDLRLLSSGPEAGLGEIQLPPRQAGSSLMPGKVNPVIPEAAAQAAMRVLGLDTSLTLACASGNLELNAFLPLIADCLLEEIDLLSRAAGLLAQDCVRGITAREDACRRHLHDSTATLTALVSELGYERVAALAAAAKAQSASIRDTVLLQGLLTPERFDELTSPEAVCRVGSPAPLPPAPDSP